MRPVPALPGLDRAVCNLTHRVYTHRNPLGESRLAPCPQRRILLGPTRRNRFQTTYVVSRVSAFWNRIAVNAPPRICSATVVAHLLFRIVVARHHPHARGSRTR